MIARQERVYEVEAKDAAAARQALADGDAGDPINETDHDWAIDDVEEIEPEDVD